VTVTAFGCHEFPAIPSLIASNWAISIRGEEKRNKICIFLPANIAD
jgi:hypothetical protein